MKIPCTNRVLATVCALMLASLVSHRLAAAPAYQGMSYTSFGSNVLSSPQSDTSLLVLSQLGADTVALNFWWFQDTIGSTTIAEDFTRYSSSVSSIEYAIDKIHSLGMKVLLKPMLDVKDGTWRANINPANKDLWFSNYTSFLGTFADIAENKNVELFSIGCELNAMENTVNNGRWTNLIANMRTRYDGLLTYAGNHDSGGIGGGYQSVPWWNQLDVIGIDAYFPLTNTANPTDAQLQQAWTTRANQIESWRASRGLTDKQVIFTEVGLGSYDGANVTPWALPSGQPVDEREQADAYEALLTVMSQRSWWDGAFWWNWETNHVGGAAGGFTPHFKLAERVLAQEYGGLIEPRPVTEWINSAGGNFGTTANWGFGTGVPNNNMVAVFDLGPDAAYTVAINSSNRTVDQLRVHSNTVTFQSSSATPRSLSADAVPFLPPDTYSVVIGVDSGDVGIVNLGPTLSALNALAVSLGVSAGATGTLNLNHSANKLNVTGANGAGPELAVGGDGTGALNVLNGADVMVQGPESNVIIGWDEGSAGHVTVAGAGSTFTVSVPPSPFFRGAITVGFVGQGRLTVADGGAVTADYIGVGQLGSIDGDGSVAGEVDNSGAIRPGATIGALTINGDLEQFESGELQFELASASSFDRLTVNGTLLLDGALKVTLVNGFSPQAGDAFNLLDWTGAFDDQGYSLVLPALAAGLVWDPSQLEITGVVSVAAAPALQGDFNADGSVDAADLATWKLGFGDSGAVGPMNGDADGDQDVDGADFLAWQRALGGGGAPNSAASASVPEPLSASLLALALSVLVASGRSRK